MAWDRSAPRSPKYGKAHRDYLASLKRHLKRYGFVECMAVECLFDTRAITNPNGMDPDGLTAGHNDDGVTYRGGEHRACNLHDAAVRARARQITPSGWSL